MNQRPTENLLLSLKTDVDFAERTLYITGGIDEEVAQKAMKGLRALEATVGDIRIVLNSNGGEELQGYAIYDAICMCKNRVVIEGYGEVQSIAAIILQAGDVRRLAYHAEFMIHHGVVGTTAGKYGQVEADAIVDTVATVKRNNKRYYRVLSLASGQPYDLIEDFCREEKEFTATEAVRFCFADEIIQPVKKKWAQPKTTKGKKK